MRHKSRCHFLDGLGLRGSFLIKKSEAQGTLLWRQLMSPHPAQILKERRDVPRDGLANERQEIPVMLREPLRQSAAHFHARDQVVPHPELLKTLRAFEPAAHRIEHPPLA